MFKEEVLNRSAIEMYGEGEPDPNQAPSEPLDCQEARLDLCNFNIVALIPAYNEERFIGSVVLKALRYCDHVIVIDDGTQDATAKIAAFAGEDIPPGW